MLDEATRQVEARLQFMAQEKVLHEQLAALNVELTRARQQRLSAVQIPSRALQVSSAGPQIEANQPLAIPT